MHTDIYGSAASVSEETGALQPAGGAAGPAAAPSDSTDTQHHRRPRSDTPAPWPIGSAAPPRTPRTRGRRAQHSRPALASGGSAQKTPACTKRGGKKTGGRL